MMSKCVFRSHHQSQSRAAPLAEPEEPERVSFATVLSLWLWNTWLMFALISFFLWKQEKPLFSEPYKSFAYIKKSKASKTTWRALSVPVSCLETRIRNWLLRAHLVRFVATSWYFKLRVIKSHCCCIPAELEKRSASEHSWCFWTSCHNCF